MFFFAALLINLATFHYLVVCAASGNRSVHSWLINNPPSILEDPDMVFGMADYRTEHHLPGLVRFVTENLLITNESTNGEAVDAFEHFFWGQYEGVVIDLGAKDGTPATNSQSFPFEKSLNWQRFLIEGNPVYKRNLLKFHFAFTVNAAMCGHHTHVHFVNVPHGGGVLEFMEERFLKQYHSGIYNAMKPSGSLAALNWTQFPHVEGVDCLPMHSVLQKSPANHINLLLLDVNGAELQVLHTIHFDTVTIDVLCVETDPNYRPKGFADHVTSFLQKKGYVDYAGQVGKNMWFVRKDYVPFARPGLDKRCFNGFRKSQHALQAPKTNQTRLPVFAPCPLQKQV